MVRERERKGSERGRRRGRGMEWERNGERERKKYLRVHLYQVVFSPAESGHAASEGL